MPARKAPASTIVVDGRTYALVSESAPTKGKTAQPVLAEAPKGERMHATRAANLANKVAKRHCAACAVGFVFDKATCPRCGATL